MVSVWSPHTFMGQLANEWLSDMQSFLHVGLPKLIFIGVGSWLLIVLVNFVTGRIIKVADSRSGVGAGRAAQVRTLASVMRATGIGIVLFLAALQVMQNVLNFNLAPLLASAGVAGVAIGLAAQTIVKDVLNGIFILVEDQYTVGDVVTLAGITGTVESMTLRKTTVRGFDGTLFVIPNSQVTNVANQSREFSAATLPISVDFSANPDEVVPLLKEIAMSVRNDPAYRNVFLEDPKILGVDSIKGSEVIYPIQVRTLPRQQFDALREIQRRIRLALEEHDMLPGSPYRIANHPGSFTAGPTMESGRTAVETADPTTAKPNEVNPFVSS
jgi:moderate conductance mechanosensitive channel